MNIEWRQVNGRTSFVTFDRRTPEERRHDDMMARAYAAMLEVRVWQKPAQIEAGRRAMLLGGTFLGLSI